MVTRPGRTRRFRTGGLLFVLLFVIFGVGGGGWLRAQTTGDPAAGGATGAGEPAGGADKTPPDAPKAQQGESEEQVGNEQVRAEQDKEQHQRILGVLPAFQVTNDMNAPPLTVKAKFKLAIRGAVDPVAFLGAAAIAGIGQAENNFPEYGQGAAGYGKRVGAAYLDGFDGAMLGNAVLPSILREDPRYFRLGKGGFKKRFVHAILIPVWTKWDSGRWGPNFGNVGGNIAAGGISNLYYPASDRGVGLTFQRAAVVTATGALGNIGLEFWPDISRKLFGDKKAKQAKEAADGTKP